MPFGGPSNECGVIKIVYRFNNLLYCIFGNIENVIITRADIIIICSYPDYEIIACKNYMILLNSQTGF